MSQFLLNLRVFLTHAVHDGVDVSHTAIEVGYLLIKHLVMFAERDLDINHGLTSLGNLLKVFFVELLELLHGLIGGRALWLLELGLLLLLLCLRLVIHHGLTVSLL